MGPVSTYIHTYIHIITPFSRRGRQRPLLSTCYDPYILLSLRLLSFLVCIPPLTFNVAKRLSMVRSSPPRETRRDGWRNTSPPFWTIKLFLIIHCVSTDWWRG